MFTFTLALLAWLGPVGATSIECEHYLRGGAQIAAVRDLRATVTDVPFVFLQAHNITHKARHLLRLGQEIERNPDLVRGLVATLHRSVDVPWTLNLRRFDHREVRDLPRREFPDFIPLLWQMVRVPAHAVAHANVIAPPFRLVAPLRHHQVGFATDPNKDGVRVYVRAHDNPADGAVYLELGLDVPPDQLSRYLEADEIRRGYGHLVQTPATHYARVPALIFARPAAK